MKEKEKYRVLIVVHTEIGLLMALIYYLSYLEGKKEPYFAVIKTSKDRFNNLNLESLPGKYELITDDLSGKAWSPKCNYKSILYDTTVKEIIVQNPLNFIVDIVIHHYSKKAIPITLLSDGIVMLSPISTKTHLKLCMKHIFRKYFNGIYELPLCVSQYLTITEKVDKLIAHKNIGVEKFIEIRTLFSEIEKYKKSIEKLFHIDFALYDDAKIIFFTQPIYRQSGVKKNYIQLLDELTHIIEKHKIKTVFKIHPADDIKLYESYENDLLSLDIVNKNIPAELLIEVLSEKMILSVASSLSLTDTNPSMQHFWLYKIMSYSVHEENNLQHIYTPKTMNEFECYLLKFL